MKKYILVAILIIINISKCQVVHREPIKSENVKSLVSERFSYFPSAKLGKATIIGMNAGAIFDAILLPVKGGDFRVVENTSDLKPELRVRRADAALSLVRLFTSPTTYHLAGPNHPWCEIVMRADVRKDSVPFATEEVIRKLLTVPQGKFGILDRPWHGFHRAIVVSDRSVKGAFLVKRIMITPEGPNWRWDCAVRELTQRVLADGTIQTVKQVPIFVEQTIDWDLKRSHLD